VKGSYSMNDSTKPYRIKNNIKKFNITNENMSDNIETGFIKITVYNAVTNEPLENAKIEVLEMRVSGLYHESGTGDIISTQTSDSEGQVPIIELQANSEPVEDMQSSEYEHIFYQIIITAEGYCIVYVTNIIIYPNITNEYIIKMSPRSLERPLYEFIITPVIP